MRREAPAFAGLIFLGSRPGSAAWVSLLESTVRFHHDQGVPTAVSYFEGALPAEKSLSGVTTEKFKIIICGCEDGALIVGTHQNYFEQELDELLVIRGHANGMGSSEITIARYEPAVQAIVTASFDGCVRLTPFCVTGDVISGTKIVFNPSRDEVRCFQHHSRPVRNVQYVQEANAFLSSGKDDFIHSGRRTLSKSSQSSKQESQWERQS